MNELKQKLVSETATIKWRELQRFFAQGNVLIVANGEDLVEIAVGFAADDAKTIADLLERGAVSVVGDAQAKIWIAEDAEVWSVVVAPFVLVQGSRSATADCST